MAFLSCANFLQIARKILKFIFDEFDNIYVSFSGGKDNGILLNLTIEYAIKIGIFAYIT